MRSKGKNKVVVDKEETAESWCFGCKDGGDLRICDYKQCLKSYHPVCVGKDNSLLISENHWTCPWHTCSLCSRSAYCHCYTCTNALCRRCLPGTDFLQIKAKNGFCNSCLRLALLIEEDKDCDSDGGKVDFTDRDTVEGLYMEYYKIIKEEAGFKLDDLHTAQDSLKMKNSHLSRCDSEESESEEQISDYDGLEYEKRRRTRKEKRSGRHKSTVPTPTKSNKQVFIGWASTSLTKFLNSIGKSTSVKLSQHEVAAIINEYVKENKLFHPEKRKTIICDTRLQPLFMKKTIIRNRVYDLLDAHFAENQDESEEDKLVSDTEDSDTGMENACKRQRKLDDEKTSQKKELEKDVPQNCFASVVVENMKLIYLNRSLLHELLKQPESFEEKVIGCFVRVKSDPYDYRSRNSHQLMQVKGVKTVPIGENEKDTILLFSTMPKEIRTSLVSDGDFLEEECENLREKVLAGEFERPTVADLQQKAIILHKDLTKHWISRELNLLRNLIDRANEKGWKRELFEYREKLKRLQTPSEQSRLLADVPIVIPEASEKTELGHASHLERKQPISERSASGEPQHTCTANSEVEHDNITHREPLQVKANKFEAEESVIWSEKINMQCKQATREGHDASKTSKVIELGSDDDGNDSYALASDKVDDLQGGTWCIRGPKGEQDKCSLWVLKRWSETCSYASKFKVWKEDENEENSIGLLEAVRIAFPEK